MQTKRSQQTHLRPRQQSSELNARTARCAWHFENMYLLFHMTRIRTHIDLLKPRRVINARASTMSRLVVTKQEAM
jgi:hypothetical protein